MKINQAGKHIGIFAFLAECRRNRECVRQMPVAEAVDFLRKVSAIQAAS